MNPLLIVGALAGLVYLLKDKLPKIPLLPNGDEEPPPSVVPPIEPLYPEPPPGTSMPQQMFRVGDLVVFVANTNIAGIVVHAGMEGREPNLVWRYTVQVTEPSWLIGELYYPQTQDILKI